MTVVWVLTSVAAVMAILGIVFSRRYQQFSKKFENDLATFGLKEFNDQLVRDIAENKRPMTDLAVTRQMMSVLKRVEATHLPEGQVALIVPQNEAELRACQELVALGRLVATPDGNSFVSGTLKDSVIPGSGTGSSSMV